jgi:hypothetical protein
MVSTKLLSQAVILSSISFSQATQWYSNSTSTIGAMPLPSDLCAITAWPTSQPGLPYTPQLPDAELASILSDIDPIRIQSIIEKLVSFGTRHTQSTQTDPNRGIGAARDWLLGQYGEFAAKSEGRMTVELQSYIQGVSSRITAPTNISNIVATLRGSAEPDRIIVVR